VYAANCLPKINYLQVALYTFQFPACLLTANVSANGATRAELGDTEKLGKSSYKFLEDFKYLQLYAITKKIN
jgi:hypothetical protein